MFDKICTILCLHTRAARIAFFSSILFLTSVTLLAAFYWYEPQGTALPAAVERFQPQVVGERFRSVFGPEDGEHRFGLVQQAAAEGDRLLQNYHYLRRLPEGGALTGEQVRERFQRLSDQWAPAAGPLRESGDPLIAALVDDVSEAIDLVLAGLSRNTPFINRRLVKARGMFHDLHAVLLAPTNKRDRYFGQTRLGRLVEQGL